MHLLPGAVPRRRIVSRGVTIARTTASSARISAPFRIRELAQ